MMYEIHIGEIFDMDAKCNKLKRTLIITEEQLSVIKQFANTKIDAELNTIYILNECEFRIMPRWEH